jgi:3alpha(or 20beta)-hydroxysteroid dehydrogenase
MGMEMERLRNQTVLVTGAGQGLGRAIADQCAAEGARVVATDIYPSKLSGFPASVFTQRLDVTSADEWTSVLQDVDKLVPPITVLVNNAAICEPFPLETESLAHYRRTVDVNQVGVFLGMRSIAPIMRLAGKGSIINISSIEGILAMGGMVSYCASKFAVLGMTKAAASELGVYGIRVNAVSPGAIETPMVHGDSLDVIDWDAFYRAVPLGRMSSPNEVANVVLFLASDDSSYCTAAEFVVDGGLVGQRQMPLKPGAALPSTDH